MESSAVVQDSSTPQLSYPRNGSPFGPSSLLPPGQHQVEPSRGGDSVNADWIAGIYHIILSRAGFETSTGGSAEATRLIAHYGWASSTWHNRSSQVRKWLMFCDEDDHSPLPATEGDVIAKIRFISLEGRLSSVSVPHYITAISQYHELHNLPTPKNTPLVRTAMTAYARRHDSQQSLASLRIGCPETLTKQIVSCGMGCSSVLDIGKCATVVFSFIFHCIATSIRMVRPEDVVFQPGVLRVCIRKRKGKSVRRTLYLQYPHASHWGTENPISLLEKWHAFRPQSPGYFDLQVRSQIGTANLGASLRACILRIGHHAPRGFYYGSHSPRIGAFNELFLLQFSREHIMRRLEWATPDMFLVYIDSQIDLTPASRWFFEHIRPS